MLVLIFKNMVFQIGKKFAIVGPSGDPMVTPSICLYNMSLYKNCPCVANLSNLTNMSFFING